MEKNEFYRVLNSGQSLLDEKTIQEYSSGVTAPIFEPPSPPVKIDYEVGDTVKVVSGPLESFVGVVEEINLEKSKVRVLVSMFGRETPVELEFAQIQKM